MAQNMSKSSERLLNGQERVDVAALSPAARTQYIDMDATGNVPVVQNTTKVVARAILTYALTVTGGSIVYTTIPVCAGGTATLQIDYVASDGATTTNIVAATSILGMTNKVPLALTLATTNPASCAAGGSLLYTVVTSNNAVGTADVGGVITLAVQPVDPNPITD
jgi:hypothetical protein